MDVNDHFLEITHENRSVDSLKRKYASLYCRILPAGDSIIPLDVRRAKNLQDEVTERPDIGDGGEGDILQDEVHTMYMSEEGGGDGRIYVAPTVSAQ